jgi:hypothetical protein
MRVLALEASSDGAVTASDWTLVVPIEGRTLSRWVPFWRGRVTESSVSLVQTGTRGVQEGGQGVGGRGAGGRRQRVACGLWLAGLRVSPTSLGRPVMPPAGMDTEIG